MLNSTEQDVLQALFALARDDRPADLSIVATELGLSCVAADEVLERLSRRGLVDPDRVRLTLPGLALAVAMVSRRGAGRKRRAA
jgi:Mn-dependent DtxR family transcriptional regulator